MAQAQDEAIQAGVPIKVLVADDRNDSNQATAIANALVQNSAIVGVIGHGTSTTTLAAAPVYQQGQLPMIAPTSTTTELATLARQGGNFVFRVIPSDQFTGTTLARYMLSAGKSRPIIFYNPQSSYSKSLQDAFATTLGLEGARSPNWWISPRATRPPSFRVAGPMPLCCCLIRPPSTRRLP